MACVSCLSPVQRRYFSYPKSYSLCNMNIFLGTYFSENALLPGLVHSNFKEDFLARQYVAAMKVCLCYSKFHTF
jgi:hypothetical protein